MLCARRTVSFTEHHLSAKHLQGLEKAVTRSGCWVVGLLRAISQGLLHLSPRPGIGLKTCRAHMAL